MAKVGSIDWILSRMKLGHHAVLAKYLVQRTPQQAEEADAVGYTANEIIRCAFKVKNGGTTVPQDAMKVMRNVPGVDPRLVAKLVMETPDTRQVAAFQSTVANALRSGKMKDSPELQEALNILVVKEVLES